MKINQIGSGASSMPNKSMEAQTRIESRGSKTTETVKETVSVGNSINGLNDQKNREIAKDKAFDDEMMKQAMAQANKSLIGANRYIERQVHEVTHAVMYTIKDTKTNEVIAEFPPRKIQDMIAKMWEMAGLFVDEKA